MLPATKMALPYVQTGQCYYKKRLFDGNKLITGCPSTFSLSHSLSLWVRKHKFEQICFRLGATMKDKKLAFSSSPLCFEYEFSYTYLYLLTFFLHCRAKKTELPYAALTWKFLYVHNANNTFYYIPWTWIKAAGYCDSSSYCESYTNSLCFNYACTSWKHN